MFSFSPPSRNPRCCKANSRSRLETRDIEETNLDLVSKNKIGKNLDLVSKKTRYIVYINHHMMFNQNHKISPNIITLLSVKIFHFHPASGETSKIIKTQCIESSWTKVKVQWEILHFFKHFFIQGKACS